jgi:hypothetical protein
MDLLQTKIPVCPGQLSLPPSNSQDGLLLGDFVFLFFLVVVPLIVMLLVIVVFRLFQRSTILALWMDLLQTKIPVCPGQLSLPPRPSKNPRHLRQRFRQPCDPGCANHHPPLCVHRRGHSHALAFAGPIFQRSTILALWMDLLQTKIPVCPGQLSLPPRQRFRQPCDPGCANHHPPLCVHRRGHSHALRRHRSSRDQRFWRCGWTCYRRRYQYAPVSSVCR